MLHHSLLLDTIQLSLQFLYQKGILRLPSKFSLYILVGSIAYLLSCPGLSVTNFIRLSRLVKCLKYCLPYQRLVSLIVRRYCRPPPTLPFLTTRSIALTQWSMAAEPVSYILSLAVCRSSSSPSALLMISGISFSGRYGP